MAIRLAYTLLRNINCLGVFQWKFERVLVLLLKCFLKHITTVCPWNNVIIRLILLLPLSAFTQKCFDENMLI